MDYEIIRKKFDILSTGELEEIVDLINKNEKEDAWIKLGISPEDFKSERDARLRTNFINTIINNLLDDNVK